MLAALERASGKSIPRQECPRRSGDLAVLYADATLAAKELGWTAKRGLDEMCQYSILPFPTLVFLYCRSRSLAMAIEQSQWISPLKNPTIIYSLFSF